MKHPEHLLASWEFARDMRESLGHLFGSDPAFLALAESCEAFVAAFEALLRCERTEDALRAACARVDEADDAMSSCAPAFFELLWSRAIEESLGDPTGGTAFWVMTTLLEIGGVGPEHISALWQVVSRPPRGGGAPPWQEVLSRDPLPGLPRWLHRAVVQAAREEDAKPLTAGAAEQLRGGGAEDLDRALVWAMGQADLGEMEAQVLAMSELAGLDSAQIASRLGRSRGAVDTALSRARKKIKTAM